MLSLRKEFKELVIVGLIIGILYFTGWHTNVSAFAQRMILNTGLFTPGTELIDKEVAEDFDYSQKIKTLDGEIVSMEEFKGKLIFLNLWASWCGPCRAEMPGIEELVSELKDSEDIVFVMLSIDQKEAAALKFMKRMKFDFPTYTMGGPLTNQLRVPSIPTTFVVSPSGKIIRKKIGMAKYNTKSFKNFLTENSKASD